MDDETLVNCSKKRLRQLHIKNESLEQAALRCIATNIQFYFKQLNNKEKIQDLPGVLRYKILQELLRRSYPDDKTTFFKDEAFPVLLSPRTCSVELTNVISSYLGPYRDVSMEMVAKVFFEEFLASITSLAPKTRHLILKNNYSYRFNFVCESLEGKCLDSLNKLQHLQRLHVELYFYKISEVLQLCQNIASLKFLDVRLEETEKFDFPSAADIRRCLANVKEFIFQPKDIYSSHDWLRVLCTRTLPKIEVVNFYCDEKPMSRTYYKNQKSGSPFKLEFSGTSNLRHLCIDLGCPEFEIDSYPDVFPMVNHLTIKGEGPYTSDKRALMDSIFKFKEIKSLNLISMEDLPPDFLSKIWPTYGPNLRTLIILSPSWPSNKTYDVNLIFQNCPKLERFSLNNIRITVDNSQPIEVIKELKSFHFNWYYDFFCSKMPLIDIVAAAPKLEEIMISSTEPFCIDDVKAITSLIRSGKLSTHLHKLVIRLSLVITPIDDKSLKEMAHLLNSAIEFLPNLTYFDYIVSQRSPSRDARRKLMRYKYPNVIRDDSSQVLKSDFYDIFEK